MLEARKALIWLLDEPFINLDDAGCQLIDGAVVKHLQAGGFVVMTQHRPPAEHYYELSVC